MALGQRLLSLSVCVCMCVCVSVCHVDVLCQNGISDQYATYAGL